MGSIPKCRQKISPSFGSYWYSLVKSMHLEFSVACLPFFWAHACFTPKCFTFSTKRRVKSGSLIHLELKWLPPALYMHNWQALCALLFIPPERHEKFMWFDFSAMYGGAVMSRSVWQVNTHSDTHALHVPERESWNPITPGNNCHGWKQCRLCRFNTSEGSESTKHGSHGDGGIRFTVCL